MAEPQGVPNPEEDEGAPAVEQAGDHKVQSFGL